MTNLFLSYDIMYEVLANKDSQFEGLFYAGVKSTGIFCRPTCTVKKPKKENVEFFETAKEALLNGYRPCKICKLLEHPNQIPNDIKALLKEIEDNPNNKISDYELIKRGLEPNRIRRWFLKNHGITLQAYQRHLRINNAFNLIKNGDKVIEAAFESGYESLSGFQHTFKKTTGITPKESKNRQSLSLTKITTPLGAMVAVAVEEGICLLEFTDRKMLETELKQLQKYFNSTILHGKNKHFEVLNQQLKEYFKGERRVFDISLVTPGTTFQNDVWKMLQQILYGQTRSYKEQAIAIGNPKAIRAVAKANGDNRIAIIIPCHRVIGENGQLTGYGGGLWRKQWLLNHEQKNNCTQHRSNKIVNNFV